MTTNHYNAALIKISQELNCSNRLILDSILRQVQKRRGKKQLDADTLYEAEILNQRMALIDRLLRQLDRIQLREEQLDEADTVDEQQATPEQDRSGNVKNELEALIMVCLQLFNKMDVNATDILSEIATRLKVQEDKVAEPGINKPT